MGSGNALGVLSLANVPSSKATWVAFYYGNYTGPMASKGNYVNPPLVKLAQALHAGSPTGIANGDGVKPPPDPMTAKQYAEAKNADALWGLGKTIDPPPQSTAASTNQSTEATGFEST